MYRLYKDKERKDFINHIKQETNCSVYLEYDDWGNYYNIVIELMDIKIIIKTKRHRRISRCNVPMYDISFRKGNIELGCFDYISQEHLEQTIKQYIDIITDMNKKTKWVQERLYNATNNINHKNCFDLFRKSLKWKRSNKYSTIYFEGKKVNAYSYELGLLKELSEKANNLLEPTKQINKPLLKKLSNFNFKVIESDVTYSSYCGNEVRCGDSIYFSSVFNVPFRLYISSIENNIITITISNNTPFDEYYEKGSIYYYQTTPNKLQFSLLFLMKELHSAKALYDIEWLNDICKGVKVMPESAIKYPLPVEKTEGGMNCLKYMR